MEKEKKNHNFITVIYTIRISLKAPFVSYHRLENCTFIVDSGVSCIIKDILLRFHIFNIFRNDSSVSFLFQFHIFHTPE